MDETLRINEIFYSIQGESTRAGEPCVFVRLAGCHLRCAYCDTAYAFHEGDSRAVEKIIDEVCSHPCDLVEITGGEPLLQVRVHSLMSRLCDLDKTVLLETSGACDIGDCDPRVVRIVDVKTPGSGEADRMDWSNLKKLTQKDEVKFVIIDRADYEWATGVIVDHDLVERVAAVLMSPVFEQSKGADIVGAEGLALAELAAWILEDGLRVRLQPQIHKFIWSPTARGV